MPTLSSSQPSGDSSAPRALLRTAGCPCYRASRAGIKGAIEEAQEGQRREEDEGAATGRLSHHGRLWRVGSGWQEPGLRPGGKPARGPGRAAIPWGTGTSQVRDRRIPSPSCGPVESSAREPAALSSPATTAELCLPQPGVPGSVAGPALVLSAALHVLAPWASVDAEVAVEGWASRPPSLSPTSFYGAGDRAQGLSRAGQGLCP